MSFHFVLFFQSCFGYFRSFAFPYEFWNHLINLYKQTCQKFSCDCINWIYRTMYVCRSIFYINVMNYCLGSSLLRAWAFSSCGEQGLLFVVACRLLNCSGFSCCGAQAVGTQAQQCGLSYSMVCGILLDQGSNLCCLHWQADSIHCATREVPVDILLRIFPSMFIGLF